MRQLKAPQEHAKLWPYGASQLSKIPLIDERLARWQTLVEDVYHFLHALHAKESLILTEYGRLSKSMDAKRTKTPGNERSGYATQDVTGVWYQYALSNQKDHATWVSALNTLLQETGKLKNDIKKRTKNYVHDTGRWATQIKNDRDALICSIEKDRKISSSSSNVSGTDPWLSHRLLLAQIQESLVKENQFQKRVLFLFEEMLKFDQFIGLEMTRIFDKFTTEQSLHFTLVQGHGSHGRSCLSAIDPSISFKTFATNNALFDNQLWSLDRTLSNFPFSVPSIDIVKCGYLYRPGTFSKWRTGYFVLTSTGYLHCFDGSFPKRVDKVANLSRGRSGTGSFSINRKESGASTTSTMPDLDIMSTETKLSLVYSISLSQPRVSVAMLSTDKMLHKHVFEITVSPIPRKDSTTSGFNYFWSSLVKENPQKWIIKADSEEGMVDWIVCLKKKIESYLPSGPPSPIFTSPAALETKIQTEMENEAKEVAERQVSESEADHVDENANDKNARLADKQESDMTLASPDRLDNNFIHAN